MDYLDGLINVEKVDKSLLYKGEKGKYLSISIVPCPNNEYSSHMILQKLSKQDFEFNKALKSVPNYDKSQLIQPVIIGNLNSFTTERPLSKQEQDDVF
jgi:hypothetical protein